MKQMLIQLKQSISLNTMPVKCLNLKMVCLLKAVQVNITAFDYIPLGVGVIISPWNFPFAIMAGTTVAALVTGNTVLLKPASTTPVVACKFIEVIEEAGMPAGVVELHSRNWC